MKSAHMKPTPIMDRVRLAVGMCWRAARPGPADLRETLRNIAIVLGLFAAFGLVGRLDYETERALELEARAERLAYRVAIADDMTERFRLARLDAEHYEDYVLACIRGDREWVLDGQRWECKATPVGPYVRKEE